MENRVTRRRFLIGTAAGSIAAALAACTPQPAPTPVPPTQAPAGVTQAPKATTVPTAAPTAIPKVPIEFNFAKNEAPFHPLKNEAPAMQEIFSKTGCKINWMAVSQADYSAKRKVWLATKQVPDYMIADTASISEYADPSVMMPVWPLVDKYAPNIKKYLNAHPSWKRWVMNGELYLLPRQAFNDRRMGSMPLIRKDLLEKLNLPMPASFEELYTTLKEMKKANPGIIGWTGRRGIKRFLRINAYPMGSGMGGSSGDVPYFDPDVDGGKYVFGPVYPEFKYVLEYFAKLFKEGLLDPDIATATDDQMHEKNSTTKGVFSFENMTFCSRWNQTLREKDPKATWGPLPCLKGQNSIHRAFEDGGFVGGWVIGAGCKDPQRLIELIDWQISPEGLDTTNWGVEGTHYNLKSPRPASIADYTREGLAKTLPAGSRELLPEVFKKYAEKADSFRTFQADVMLGMQTWCILWDNAPTYLWDAPGEADAWYDLTAKQTMMHLQPIDPPFDKAQTDRLTKLRSAVEPLLTPAYDKIVLGQMSLSDYDKVVEQAKKAGALEMETIYNEANAKVK